MWDRADGITNALGTPTPNGAILSNYSDTIRSRGYLFEEASDSPTIEFGEQCTIVHKYFVDRQTGVTLQIGYQRSKIMVDSAGNLTRVLSTTLVPIPKTNGLVNVFTVTSEAKSFANPPDEFDIEVVEINPALEKHPRYSPLSYLDRYLVRNANLSDNQDLAAQYTQIISQIIPAVGNPNEKIATQELLFKNHKGIENFYLSGYKISWSQYFWSPQVINPGGYIEDPFSNTGGSIPYYFWDTNQDGSGQNIFSATNTKNANMFPILSGNISNFGLSWLRQTDRQALNRTWWKVTRSWVGANFGHWDVELYNPLFQPYQTQDYQGPVI